MERMAGSEVRAGSQAGAGSQTSDVRHLWKHPQWLTVGTCGSSHARERLTGAHRSDDVISPRRTDHP